MTVIFCILVVGGGVFGAFCFITGNPLGGFVSSAISVLSIVALVGRVMAERGLFGNLAKKQDIPKAQEQNQTKTSADEIREYKKLFDEGVITEAEFEEKKKQIMGL